MAVGSYMGKTFTVSRKKIFTPSNLKGNAGGDWAIHETVGKKGTSQYLGPKLRGYTLDLLLRAQDGINPRSTLEFFQNQAESGGVDYFIIGNKPLSSLPFKLVSVGDSWDAVLNKGVLIECKLSLTIEEYQ